MLRFMDSFDHYSGGDVAEKWTQSHPSMAPSPGNGRRGTASMRTSVSASIYKALDAQPTWIIGCAVRYTMHGDSRLLWVSQGAAGSQVEVRVTTTGALAVTRNGAPLGQSANEVMRLGVYSYLEVMLTIHASTGAVTVVQDGTPRVVLSGVNTQAQSAAWADTIQVGAPQGLGTLDIDDLYICDGTGAMNNTLLGDCRVDCLWPDGEGSHSAWTPSGGPTHYTLVDDPTPNDDTDYLATQTAGARDTQTLQNMATLTAPQIRGVQHCVNARRDDLGTRLIKSCLKSGATTAVSATTFTLANAYAYWLAVWETDPATAAAWTPAAIDALEAGVEHQ